MKFCYFAKSLLLGLIALGLISEANAQSTFTYSFETDNTEFALAELDGSTFTATSSDSSTLDLFVLGSQAAEYDTTVDPPAATGNAIDAIFLSSDGGLIIDNPSLNDDQSFAATQATGEDGFFNGGETFTFEFGTDVIFTEIDFFGIGTNSENGIDEVVQILIEGNGTPFSFPSGPNSDTYTDPFGAGATILAGTDITITSSQVSDAFGVENFTVTGEGTSTAIPEPSSLAVIGFGSLLMVTRRRR